MSFEPEYEWKSAMDIIQQYPNTLDAAKYGWEFEGGAFRRKIKMDEPTETAAYNIHKLWATRITGVVLCLAGLFGVSMDIQYSGWLIFIGFLVLM